MSEQDMAVIARIINAKIPVIIFISTVSKVMRAAPIPMTALQMHAISLCFLEWQLVLTVFITSLTYLNKIFNCKAIKPSYDQLYRNKINAKTFWVKGTPFLFLWWSEFLFLLREVSVGPRFYKEFAVYKVTRVNKLMGKLRLRVVKHKAEWTKHNFVKERLRLP